MVRQGLHNSILNFRVSHHTTSTWTRQECHAARLSRDKNVTPKYSSCDFISLNIEHIRRSFFPVGKILRPTTLLYFLGC